jgi:hypothetical protein
MADTKADQLWNVMKLAGIAGISLAFNHLINNYLTSQKKNTKSRSKA